MSVTPEQYEEMKVERAKQLIKDGLRARDEYIRTHRDNPPEFITIHTIDYHLLVNYALDNPDNVCVQMTFTELTLFGAKVTSSPSLKEGQFALAKIY